MKRNTKSARPTDDEVRARDAQVDALMKKADAERRPSAPFPIFYRFSTEQQVQIRRLSRAGDFEGTTEDEAIVSTIAWLAEAALFVFGLDPIARRAFDRISEAAGTNKVDEGAINEIINDMHEAGEAWTSKQREAERGAALKGRAA